MSRPAIRLHEVEPGLGIPAGSVDRLRSQRLNLFPGRALGEDELDRIQAWGDARIAALESGLKDPGILYGLGCRLHADERGQVIEVLPGNGLGRGGELHRLTASLQKLWVELCHEYRSLEGTPNELLDGLYLVVLEAVWLHLDVSANLNPCARGELDRLRDARLERGLIPSLAPVPAELWDLDEVEQQPLRAANRFLGTLLEQPQRMPEYRGIGLALVGVRNDALLWLDAAAGAFSARPSPVHERLRTHLHHACGDSVRTALREGRTPLEGITTFQPAYLPAAAELPTFLLENPAGVAPLPHLHWIPAAARKDLQILPESSLPVVMRTNLVRAPTPFDRLAGDHYRIGLVLSDEDYRGELLQLPQLEPELPSLVRRHGRLAHNAAVASQRVWDELAAGFDTVEHPDVWIPERPADVDDPEAVLKELAARPWRAASAGAELDAPYSGRWPAEPPDLPARESAPASEGSLLTSEAAEREEQERLTELLSDIDELLEMLEEEKKQQRSLVDSITIDLAQLAGGVAGDGSGMRVAKAARGAEMQQKVLPPLTPSET